MFRIDPEFKKLIPALAPEEYSQLETNIVDDGCRDPLTVWEEEGLLLDGHNRFEICKRYGIEHETAYVSLDSRQHAINWIINNQLGRRNVTPEQASYLRGKRYNMEKVTQGTRNQYTEKDQNDTFQPTADRLADEFKVSAPTIKRDGKYAEAVDTLSDAIGDEARTAVLSGDSKVTKQDVVDAAAWYKGNAAKQTTPPMGTVRLQPTPAPVVLTPRPPATTRDLPGTQTAIPTTEDEILEAARRIRKERAAETRQDRVKEAQSLRHLPDKVFNVIYADPPWEYSNTGVHGAANHHYPTMPLCDLECLPEKIGMRVADNAVLFMWITNPLMAEAFHLMDHWGFTYKTNIVWVKTDLQKPGSGFYVRGRHELLFIATRGAFTPLDQNIAPPIGSVVESPVREHSRKPEVFYEIIERLYPQCRYIELFARSERPDWESWGNEVGKFDGGLGYAEDR